MPARTTYRGELNCFSCARYLGEFEARRWANGAEETAVLPRDDQQPHAIQTDRGLRCSVCGGRAMVEQLDRQAA